MYLYKPNLVERRLIALSGQSNSPQALAPFPALHIQTDFASIIIVKSHMRIFSWVRAGREHIQARLGRRKRAKHPPRAGNLCTSPGVGDELFGLFKSRVQLVKMVGQPTSSGPLRNNRVESDKGGAGWRGAVRQPFVNLTLPGAVESADGSIPSSRILGISAG